jgi:hypothetical protein
LLNVSAIRRENMLELFHAFSTAHEEQNQPERGRMKRFAEKFDTSPRSFGHVWNGRRNIGDELARRLELAFSKPVNWMDTDHDAASSSAVRSATTPLDEILDSLFLRAKRANPVATHAALLAVVADA